MQPAVALSAIADTSLVIRKGAPRNRHNLRDKGNLLFTIVNKNLQFAKAPADWKRSCTHTEWTLHQIAPYVGKLKSSIARSLIQQYSRKGDLVVDPFAGAGTIVLEAALAGRHAFGSDISPYAKVLSNAKLFPPRSLREAIRKAERALTAAAKLPSPDLRSVPTWVRAFFHRETLREAISFAQICREPGNEFLLACFLGILHHQRPGFLSYPSSHLVPYLRDKKYPESDFPEMYSYRELRPRLIAKITRTFVRFSGPSSTTDLTFRRGTIEHITLPVKFDSLITSPPYMNALDYGRDNRLRLWFIDPHLVRAVDNGVTKKQEAFISAIRHLAHRVETGLNAGGYCVLVVGESLERTFAAHPSEVVFQIITQRAPSLQLREVICDDIPDVRRTRRECKGIKREHFLVFQKNRNAN